MATIADAAMVAPPTAMEFHSALAESADLDEACEAVAGDVRRRLGNGPVDLLFVCASAGYGRQLDRLPVVLQEQLGASTLVGCTGDSLLTESTQVRERRAVAVLAARMPGAEIAAVALNDADLPHPDAPPDAWRRLLPESCANPERVRAVAVLGEPFHCDTRALLAGLDFVLPGVAKVGGIASGSHHPGGNALFCGRQRTNQGAVLLTIAGDVTATAVVSQGCRPIGRPGRITGADRNRLATVDDQPVQAFVRDQLQTLDDHDRTLADGSPLFLGIQSDPFASGKPEAGEFLVRNVLGIDSEQSLVVGERLGVGRVVQLHLRDAESGRDDLRRQLQRADLPQAHGALMFRCIGRVGDDHDVFAELLPETALCGCTCNGEIGPVAATTHLHGYTAACLLLGEARS